MTAPVRLGVIGAGGIAKAYGEILGGAFPVPAVAAGVADVREDAAQALAAPLGAPTFATAEALLEARAGELDAVVLCTPPNTHPALAATFAAAGVHVLCEKPLAVDRATAEAMVTTAAGHRTLLGMATKFRFCDDIRTVASYMADGRLGAIRLVEVALPDTWAGHHLKHLEHDAWRVVLVQRGGASQLVTNDLVGQEGDVLHLALRAEAATEFEAALAAGPAH